MKKERRLGWQLSGGEFVGVHEALRAQGPHRMYCKRAAMRLTCVSPYARSLFPCYSGRQAEPLPCSYVCSDTPVSSVEGGKRGAVE